MEGKYNCLIIGAGMAGAVAARRLASAAFTLGWVCINCLAQGEHPIYFACVLVLPLLRAPVKSPSWARHSA